MRGRVKVRGRIRVRVRVRVRVRITVRLRLRLTRLHALEQQLVRRLDGDELLGRLLRLLRGNAVGVVAQRLLAVCACDLLLGGEPARGELEDIGEI